VIEQVVVVIVVVALLVELEPSVALPRVTSPLLAARRPRPSSSKFFAFVVLLVQLEFEIKFEVELE